MTKEAKLLQQAQALAQAAETWADLSNALFNPVDGIVSSAYRNREKRMAFRKTKEYQEIFALLEDAMKRTGLVEGATPKKKSGRFVVRLPQVLHASLEREAASEGVSLNQLAVSKLSIPLSAMLQRPHGK